MGCKAIKLVNQLFPTGNYGSDHHMLLFISTNKVDRELCVPNTQTALLTIIVVKYDDGGDDEHPHDGFFDRIKMGVFSLEVDTTTIIKNFRWYIKPGM